MKLLDFLYFDVVCWGGYLVCGLCYYALVDCLGCLVGFAGFALICFDNCLWVWVYGWVNMAMSRYVCDFVLLSDYRSCFLSGICATCCIIGLALCLINGLGWTLG